MHTSLGKVSVKESGLWLPIGHLSYDWDRDTALFKPDWSVILPLCRRHEGEAELRGHCKPYPDLPGEPPYLDRGEVQFAKSSKTKVVYAMLYARQDERGQTMYDLVIRVPVVLKLLGGFSHIHFEDREKNNEKEAE